MLVLGGNQHNSIHIEHPDPTSKGVEYFVPIAYMKFAEKELEKGIPEIDIQSARSYFGEAIYVSKGRDKKPTYS